MPGPHVPNGVPLIKSQHVKNNRISEIDLNISKELSNKFKTTILEGGELLLTLVGASIGRTAIVPDSLKGANVSRAVAVIRISSEYLTRFIELQLNYMMSPEFIAANAGGSAQPVLNINVINDFIFRIPSTNEQKEIVRRAESLFAVADRIETNYNTLQEKIDHLPQAILSKAFRGNLVEQDPNDGSALDLLAKIKTKDVDKEKPQIAVKTKRKIVRIKPNVPKSKIDEPTKIKQALDKVKKIEDIELSNQLYQKFKGEPFVFDDIVESVNLNYEETKKQLFEVLDISEGLKKGMKLESKYGKNKIQFQFKKI